jgi:hypothetical protein
MMRKIVNCSQNVFSTALSSRLKILPSKIQIQVSETASAEVPGPQVDIEGDYKGVKATITVEGKAKKVEVREIASSTLRTCYYASIYQGQNIRC